MTDLLLAGLFLLIAVLYGAVGLGGGSGYLAAMGLVGLEPALMRPTALTLNILVAGLGTWRFARAGHFAASVFWPLALTSVPFAYLGGRLSLAGSLYRPLVGLLLLLAAGLIWRRGAAPVATAASRRLPGWLPWPLGAVLGFGSGLLGLGGGVFLGPVLILSGWLQTRPVMGVTAAFVLVNSAAGLIGHLSAAPALPPGLVLWLPAVGLGGWVGAGLGSRHLAPHRLRLVLILILIVAGIRLLL